MRHFINTFCALFISLAASSAFADKGGSCHFHGNKAAAESVVIACADTRRDTLVKNGKLHTSWSAVKHYKHYKIEQIDGNKGKEWKLSYKNTVAPEKDKQTLFMFFTAPGNFLAANHTGR